MITALVRRGAMAAALCLAALPAKAETLGDALAAAYMNSGLLEQQRAVLRAADEDVAQAVSALRPVIAWSARAQRDFGTSSSAQTGGAVGFGDTDATIGLTLDLLVWDAGSTRLGIDAAKETVLRTREQLRSVEQAILLRAAAAYISVLEEAENVQLRENNLRLLNEELRAAQDRFEVGEVTRTDVALAEARTASARATLAASRGALDQARAEYTNAVGRAPSALQPITRLPQIERNEDSAKSIAVRQHPDLLAAQRDVTVATINAERARLVMAGSATLSGSVGYRNRTSDETNVENYRSRATVGLSYEQPIYQGGGLLSASRQALAQRDAALANVHVTQLDIIQDVSTALALLRIADAAIAATQEEIRAAQVAFDGVREEAQLGQRTTLDVLTAEQDLLDARTALTAAVADRNFTVFQLLQATGLMTASYLGLNVQQYDPAAYYKMIENAPALSVQGDRLDRVLRGIGRN